VAIAPTQNAAEPDTNGQFTFSLSTTAPSDTQITYSVGGSAIPGADYGALPGSITIPATQTSAVLDLPVLDDALEEGSETITLTLETVTNSENNVFVGGAKTASITLADDDATTIELLGTNSRDDLIAPDGNNYTLRGLGDNDSLIGNSGNDILIGGEERDQLTGGGGGDRFVYETTNDGDDRIADFQAGVDILDFASLFNNDPNFGATTAQERFDNYLKVRVKSARTIVLLDLAGDNGDNFQRFTVLENAANISIADFNLV
jgi:Ca2+-binding RTX toxin-like protein